LVIKDGKQLALGNYESITSTGFDIEEILKSYNDQLQKETKKIFNQEKEKATVAVAKVKDMKEEKEKIGDDKPGEDLIAPEE